jgi:hypothetical protein
MSYADYRTAPGFGERSQQPIENIPTTTEAFLRWGTTLDPDHPFKYELSNGRVSRTMIQVSRGHWRIRTGSSEDGFPLDASAPTPTKVGWPAADRYRRRAAKTTGS